MLAINHLNKVFDRFAITDINLKVNPADYHILLGKSGAGKSVLLELIAGITLPDSGNITLFGKDITKLPNGKRRTGLIFQSPAIFPHLTVFQNIAYPMIKIGKHDKIRKVNELAEIMGIAHLLTQKSTVLSGGELQRVALARIFASEPQILLLDEPLSAIDTSLKADIRGLLRSLNKKGMPILHVTHDFEEAVALGNIISVIENGQIVQSDTTQAVIDNPRNTFSANFTGERNFFKATINGHHASIVGNNNILVSILLNDTYSVDEANILIRSKTVSILLHEPEISNMNNFRGTITNVNPKKEGYQICIDIGINLYATITEEAFEKLNIHEGLTVYASFKASSVEVII